jgi:hypothetical protein
LWKDEERDLPQPWFQVYSEVSEMWLKCTACVWSRMNMNMTVWIAQKIRLGNLYKVPSKSWIPYQLGFGKFYFWRRKGLQPHDFQVSTSLLGWAHGAILEESPMVVYSTIPQDPGSILRFYILSCWGVW